MHARAELVTGAGAASVVGVLDAEDMDMDRPPAGWFLEGGVDQTAV